MNNTLYRDVIDALTKHLGSIEKRRYYLNLAFYNEPWVAALPAPDVNLDARQYTRQLVELLTGEVAETRSGELSIVVLLNAIAGELSGAPARQLQRLASQIVAEQGDSSAHAAPEGNARAMPMAANPSEAGPLRLLFLASNPKDSGRLRLGEEMRTIEERLRETALRDQFVIEQGWAVRDADLPRLLMEHRPQIVHFAGHGVRAGQAGGRGDDGMRHVGAGEDAEASNALSSELVFEDGAGKQRPIPAEILANLFRILKDDIQCVLFNACWSLGQAQALVDVAQIPIVIGMTRPISDPAAIAFAAGFYRALGYGRTIAEAVELGRIELAMLAPAERDIPQMLTADGVDGATFYLARQ